MGLLGTIVAIYLLNLLVHVQESITSLKGVELMLPANEEGLDFKAGHSS